MNDAQCVVARTQSGEQEAWLTGFDDQSLVWVERIDDAMAYHRDGAEAARLRCANLPDHDDVLYAACCLKSYGFPSAQRQPFRKLSPNTEHGVDLRLMPEIAQIMISS